MVYSFKDIVIDSRTGLNPRRNFVLGSGDNNYITIKDIYNGQINITDKTDKVDDAAIQIIKKRSRIKVGDILFVSIGRIGEAAIVKSKDDSWDVNESVFVFTVNKEIVIPEYFCLLFQSDGVKKQLAANSSGSTFKSIKMNQLEKMSFYLPSLSTQRRIITKLAKIKTICELREIELETLDNLVKARFVEMFGDPETNPMGWNGIRLADICDLQNGYAFKSDDYTDNTSVLNCRMSNIRPGGGFDADYSPKFLPEEYWEKYKAYQLYDGDVIIAMTDMASDPKILGVPTIVKSNGHRMLLNQRVGKLVFLEENKINRVFLMHYLGLEFIRKNLARKAGGSTQINVGKPAVLSTMILEPPKELQDLFAEFVNQVDKSKKMVQKALDKAQLIYDSLLLLYFG